jgi:hypothetical protein
MVSMKNRLGFIGIAMMVALVGTAVAGDISGKWIVAATGFDIELNFKVDGTTLKGTGNHPLHGEAKIKEGKIDGDKISFLVIRQDGLTEKRALWKGVIEGEVIRFIVTTVDLGPAQLIAFRPKAPGSGQPTQK